MGTIDQLPVLERPREKALRFGIKKLSNDELLAILLRTGVKGASALELANRVSAMSNGLINLFSKPYEALLDINGIGPGKALVLASCFELCHRIIESRDVSENKITSYDLFKRYQMRLAIEEREVFILVVLNRQRRIIYEEYMYRGNESGVNCDPTEVVKKVIKNNGTYFYIIHNHPSGNYKPSNEDLLLTHEIIRASNRVKVYALDHLIITSEGYYSFRSSCEAVHFLR